MDKEDFVTYEQALALKKLGFREICLCYYERNVLMLFNEDGILYNIKNNKVGIGGSFNRFSGIYKDICDAPTLAQAQKWLRKEKNALICPWIHSNYEENAEGIYKHVLYDTWDYDLWINGKDESPLKSNEFNSPEEALSAGITECLKSFTK